MGWIVYDKTGVTERCTIKELEYNGPFMGEKTISCSLQSPVPISFEIGDYLVYRGEKFYLDYDPSQTKNSSSGSVQDAFEYELTFRTIDIELMNCQLLDYVPYGNDYHYQPSPSFSFVGNAKTFAERIQANMNRNYPGWTISVHESVDTEDAEIEIDNVTCWNALVTINKQWGLHFSTSGRMVKIGYPEEEIDHTFYYGKNNGLYRIERVVNSDEAIVTRLYAYGGSRNIPDDYNRRSSDFSGKTNLMLPGYMETGKSYIESDSKSIYGIREYSVVFDDIYPSISGVELPNIGRIDEIVSADQITESTETESTFKVVIKNIGFDINDYLTTETATISMKSGSLIGYEFEITNVSQLENGNYELTLNKSNRDNFIVPNAGQNISAGDRFVLLNITMPEQYIEYAEEKLLEKATAYLLEYDHTIYSYDIGVDEIYMARNGDLQNRIKEGMKLRLYDDDLGLDFSIIIQSLVIKENGSIPTYEISLSDKPISGTIDKLWDAINNVKDKGSIVNGGISSGSGSSPEELNKKYLRKDVDDVAKGNISFERNIGSYIYIDGWDGKGWQIESDGSAELEAARIRSDIYIGNIAGSPTFASGFTGWGWQIDTPTATGEMDNLFIRKTFTAYEIVYSQIYGLGGSQIVSDINKIGNVEVMEDRYRCYMDDMDGLMLMNLRNGDGVRIQSRTGTTSIKYIFGRCIEVGNDYFDIAIPLLEGTGQPEAGDFAIRWGNNEDTDRQGLIYLTTADSGAPFIDVYDGITDISTEGKLKARLGHLTGIRTQRGDQLSGYGAYLNGIYVENSTYIMQDGNTLEQTFIAMNGKFESLIESIRNDMSSEGGNILVNSSFSQNTNYWEVSNEVYFINVEGQFLYVDDAFYVEKDQVADIYNDGGRNVLRLRETYILQRNNVMNIPERTEESEEGYTYSFSLFYKVTRPGTLKVGFTGSELYVEQQLQATEGYQKLSKSGKWNETGDFRIEFTGEIYIYGVSLFSDEMADALIRLETKIEQTEEQISLMATKEYVDSETGQIYLKYDSQLQITAEQISGISTKVDTIEGTIESAGWITRAEGVTLFAKKEMENGSAIVNAINVGTGGILIQANRIDLVGAVTFSMLNSSLQNTINGKVDEGDLGTLAYASSISKNNFATSLLNEFNGKMDEADAGALAYLDKVESAQLGTTIISGGHIITSLIDTDSIFANAAYIGNFTIENGWLTCNSDTQGVNGYIALRSSNTHIHLGRDVMPATQGENATLTASFSNQNRPKNYSSVDPGSCISIEASAIGNYSSYLHPVGLSCQGELHVRGSVSMVESLFYGVNANISSSNCADAHVLRYQRVFVFQPTSYASVYLPSDTAIADAFGSQNDGCNSVDRAVIIIYILVTRYATEQINVQSTISIVDENGNEIKQSSAVNRSNFNMGRGDSAILMYYNRNWYIINRTQ